MSIPLHFQALLQTVEGAVILAQSVYFQGIIGDAQIIGATAEAAALYGFHDPSELEGKFTSELDHPDDYLAVKCISVARMLGLASPPAEYDIRIILPNGEVRYVRKQVQQMEHGNDTYWMTVSTEIPSEEAKPLPAISDLVSAEAIRQWFNMMSVSELQMLAHKYIPLRNQKFFKEFLTPSEFQIKISEIQIKQREAASKKRFRKPQLPVGNTATAEYLEVGLGRTYRLPDHRFLHRCGNCAETWASHSADPSKCPRSRDDNRGPKCGVLRWRTITDRGLATARTQNESRLPDS